jgi:ribosomal-protein-alanine N-acetyltransferase
MSERWQMRRAVLADLKKILILQSATPETPQWNETVWQSIVAQEATRPARAAFVAENTDQLMGFAVASCVGEVAELESVAVAHAERRQGIGRALCLQAISWAKEQVAEVIQLEVRAGSAGARALYCSLGFQEQGLRRNYYREPEEDAVMMTLRLGF